MITGLVAGLVVDADCELRSFFDGFLRDLHFRILQSVVSYRSVPTDVGMLRTNRNVNRRIRKFAELFKISYLLRFFAQKVPAHRLCCVRAWHECPLLLFAFFYGRKSIYGLLLLF